jgi:hypothetical protein
MLVLLLVLAALLAVAAPAGAATRCDVRRDGRRLGPTYVTSLAVVRVSCTEGKAVIRAYDRCRRAHGGADGRCPSRVRRFRCFERRRSSPAEISATVDCRRGARRVRFAYSQFV